MKLYTDRFVQWLLDQYNMAEDQVYAYKKGTFKYYSMDEILERFKEQTGEEGKP